MTSQIEELVPLSLGKGSIMRTFIDHSKPDEPSWVEVPYDGKEDSDLMTVPNHWYRDHDEIVEVLEGRMIFYLDGKEYVKSAGDPPLLIQRGRVHGFTTSPNSIPCLISQQNSFGLTNRNTVKGEFVRATERTKPAGDFKARFFQDLLQGGSLPGLFMTMRVAYDGDMYPSLPGGFKFLDWLFVTNRRTYSQAFRSNEASGIEAD